MAPKWLITIQLKLEYAIGGVEKVKSRKRWIDKLMFQLRSVEIQRRFPLVRAQDLDGEAWATGRVDLKNEASTRLSRLLHLLPIKNLDFMPNTT